MRLTESPVGEGLCDRVVGSGLVGRRDGHADRLGRQVAALELDDHAPRRPRCNDESRIGAHGSRPVFDILLAQHGGESARSRGVTQ